MGTIKDIYDLGKELKESISDRKQLDIIMLILDKVQSAERENFELEKSQFNLERKHEEEVSKLNSKISDLESQLKSKAQPFVGSIPLSRG